MEHKDFNPTPIDVSNVVLPDRLEQLTELLARNVHNVWARNRIDQGWSYGPQLDADRKHHPCLVPYEDLPESEKLYDRDTAIETLKVILQLGYQIN